MNQHIVKSVILEKIFDFDIENDGKIRVFAVNVNNAEEMAMIATNLVTPINPYGFLIYVGFEESESVMVHYNDSNKISNFENAKEAIRRGEKTMVFHEDTGLAYPEKLKNVTKRYPGIIFQEINDIVKNSMDNEKLKTLGLKKETAKGTKVDPKLFLAETKEQKAFRDFAFECAKSSGFLWLISKIKFLEYKDWVKIRIKNKKLDKL